jgi:hypothetical protein
MQFWRSCKGIFVLKKTAKSYFDPAELAQLILNDDWFYISINIGSDWNIKVGNFPLLCCRLQGSVVSSLYQKYWQNFISRPKLFWKVSILSVFIRAVSAKKAINGKFSDCKCCLIFCQNWDNFNMKIYSKQVFFILFNY